MGNLLSQSYFVFLPEDIFSVMRTCIHSTAIPQEMREYIGYMQGLPRWLSGKESSCQYGRCRRRRFNLWVGKIPWRRKWQPTPIFLPGESHGQRSLAGYRPCGRKSWTQLSNYTTTAGYCKILDIMPSAIQKEMGCFIPE